MVTTTALKLAGTELGYVVLPASARSAECLLVERTGEVRIADIEKITLTTPFTMIAGILGVIRLRANLYLLTVDGASEVGSIYSDVKLYKMATFSILPLSSAKASNIDEEEAKYLDILKAHLDAAELYFSYDYDLTRPFSSQKQGDYDAEFMWNHYVSQPLIEAAKKDAKVGQYILPLIYGYVKFVSTAVYSTPVTFGLVTRRSRLRAGTRYFRRGIDKEGNVANFNETEQFLVSKDEKGTAVSTYLQTRGSVPVYWAEMNTLQYKPALLLGPGDYLPARHHFDKMTAKYGTNFLVNLVDQKGHEKPVKLAYENAVTALADPQLKYTYFDYHTKCRHMRTDRVRLLLDDLSRAGLSSQDYTRARVGTDQHVTLTATQSHAVRTNCMDCLDRTNVVQSMLGRWFLQQQLEDLDVVGKSQDWGTSDPVFNTLFQNIWADNADAVSNAYSGTGALKTDTTRTGKRTKIGALNDLWNSMSRYFKNNFRDGARQDSFDLFLGNAAPYELAHDQLADKRPTFVQLVPYGLLVSVIIFFTTLTSPNGSLAEFKNWSFLAFFFFLAAASFRYILVHGIQYVNWPKLCPLDFLVKRDLFKRGAFAGVMYLKSPVFHRFVDEMKKE